MPRWPRLSRPVTPQPARTPGTPEAASFSSVGHPEKLTDFAYRAVHEMTVAAKAIAAGYYGQAAKHSYFNGCSTGGRQAIAEAQRFPGDYDGIIAGDPDFYATHIQAAQLFIGQAAHKDEASYIPPAKYAALHKAALDACDALDGVKDGVIEDPTRCKFDPGVIACKGASTPSCLTPEQVETARKTYAGTHAGKADAVGPGAGQRIRLGFSFRPAAVGAGGGHVSVSGLQRSQMGLPYVGPCQGCGCRGQGRWARS